MKVIGQYKIGSGVKVNNGMMRIDVEFHADGTREAEKILEGIYGKGNVVMTWIIWD